MFSGHKHWLILCRDRGNLLFCRLSKDMQWWWLNAVIEIRPKLIYATLSTPTYISRCCACKSWLTESKLCTCKKDTYPKTDTIPVIFKMKHAFVSLQILIHAVQWLFRFLNRTNKHNNLDVKLIQNLDLIPTHVPILSMI